MLTWSSVEAALTGRAGWKRRGREWHGPCPVTGSGRDCAWFARGRGDGDDVRGGCRACGGRLDASAFRAHLVAVVGGAVADVSAAAIVPVSDTVARDSPRRGRLAGDVWGATESIGAVGARYLEARLGAGGWSGGSVRWLPRSQAVAVGLWPRLPDGAVGALVYRFAAPGEAETLAVQIEALDGAARRMRFDAAGKRPAVAGSHFGAGRRVFQAFGGKPDRGCWLTEGPLDALAVVQLSRAGALDLAGAAVVGVAGTAGFQVRAVHARGLVTLAPDRDAAGRRAAVRLGTALRIRGVAVRVRRPPVRMDWSDCALAAWQEREAIRC